jgi:hypothetical protein
MSMPLFVLIPVFLAIVGFLSGFFGPSVEITGCESQVPWVWNSGGPMVDAPTVDVSGTNITVDGQAVGSTRPAQEQMAATGPAPIEDLTQALAQLRTTWEQQHPGRRFPGSVSLSMDRRLPAGVVKCLIQSCLAAGYTDIAFVVTKSTWSSWGSLL